MQIERGCSVNRGNGKEIEMRRDERVLEGSVCRAAGFTARRFGSDRFPVFSIHLSSIDVDRCSS